MDSVLPVVTPSLSVVSTFVVLTVPPPEVSVSVSVVTVLELDPSASVSVTVVCVPPSTGVSSTDVDDPSGLSVTDVVDPAQGYPISDNGKPYNGDIPQMLLLNLGTGNNATGLMDDGGYLWGNPIETETAVDAVIAFSSKPGVGTPALFMADEDGEFSY